jgi:hypothetical protein
VRAPLVVGALLAGAACSSTGGSRSNLNYRGALGKPASAVVFSNVLLADVTVDGVTGQRIVVDTGSPVVVLAPAAFPGVALPAGYGPVGSLTFGGLTFDGPSVVAADLLMSPDPTVPIAGLLGCTIMCDFELSLNYRDGAVALGPGATPTNVDVPGQSVPFKLEGGGNAMLNNVPGTIPFPPSRIALTVTVEGSDHSFVMDSGASYVFLRSALYTQIVSDGRAQISGLSATSVSGMSSASVTRLRKISTGGAEVDGPPATMDTSLEPLLDGIAQEVGHPVDGLLGGTFLREFFDTVDYPNKTLHLQRYSSRSFIVDEFQRVGVSFGVAVASGYPVQAVLAGTDAAANGVAVGDVIVSVDGQQLAALGPTAASALLSGAVGSTKMVGFGKTQAAQLNNRVVAILVDELLPLQ